eukprot:COSAG01_NODE_71833_length_254_cov_1.800000_1_plen_58_part_10
MWGQRVTRTCAISTLAPPASSWDSVGDATSFLPLHTSRCGRQLEAATEGGEGAGTTLQ